MESVSSDILISIVRDTLGVTITPNQFESRLREVMDERSSQI